MKETVKVKDTKTDRETEQEIEKLVLVAKNRHKATEQKFPSLEEHFLEYAEAHTEEETLSYAKSLIVKPCIRTYTFHKKGIISPFHPGDTIKYEKRNKYGKISEQLGNELPSIRKLAEASSTLGASMTPLLLNTATFY